MNSFFQKNFKAIIRGGIITLGLTILLKITGVSYNIIDPVYSSKPLNLFLDVLSFVICWLVLSSLLNKYSIYKIIGVLGLLILAIVAERLLDISNNPFTIPFIILFWLGSAHLILPRFFRKYRIAIFGAYGLVISYFFFVYITTPSYDLSNRANFANFILIPIPVFASLWVYEQWCWLKMLKADKAKAELAFLKNQINPHFFFNTLNNLYGLVVEKSDKAPEVVLKLSDMMRYTIYNGREELVLIEDEIKYLENYIELHKIRYQRKVEILFIQDVEEGLKITPLLFIILLENAFKHGVEKLRDNSFIHLHIQSQGNRLFFTIKNNFGRVTSNQTIGIGLRNLKERLKHTYPDCHELIVEEKASVYKVQLNIELV